MSFDDSSDTRMHSQGDPVLCFTGDRSNGRFIIGVMGERVSISHGQLAMLIRLVAQRHIGTGYVRDEVYFYPKAVCRLRKIFGEVAPGSSQKLIETGVGPEYRLAVDSDNISFEPSFLELAHIGLITEEEAEQVRKWCTPA